MFENLKTKPEHIDLSVLEEITDGSSDLLHDMLDIFFLQVPRFTMDMEEANRSGEYAKLGAIAHKAKSTVATMGITALIQKMKDFELLAKSGERPEEYAAYIDLFKTNCDKAIKELKDIKSNL